MIYYKRKKKSKVSFSFIFYLLCINSTNKFAIFAGALFLGSQGKTRSQKPIYRKNKQTKGIICNISWMQWLPCSFSISHIAEWAEKSRKLLIRAKRRFCVNNLKGMEFRRWKLFGKIDMKIKNLFINCFLLKYLIENYHDSIKKLVLNSK